MRGRKLTQDERNKRIHDVGQLYLQGKTQQQIAELLGCAQSQISYDLKILRRYWRMSAIRNFDEVKERELARIDRLESEAWDAFNLSKQMYEKSFTEQINDGSAKAGEAASGGKKLRAQITKETRTGDTSFLQTIQWCIGKRSEILGLNAPTKQEVTSDLNVRSTSKVMFYIPDNGRGGAASIGDAAGEVNG